MAFLKTNITVFEIPVKAIRWSLQALLLVVIISIIHILFDRYDFHNCPKIKVSDNHRQLEVNVSVLSHRKKPKIILFWTQFFSTEDYEVGLGEDPFVLANCKRSTYRCVTTRDRSLLNKSDAIIFHPRDLNINDLPPSSTRQPQQKYVFFNLESPAYTDLSLLEFFKHYFNWTMTYRRDSDIVHLQNNGQLQCINPGKVPCQCLPSSAACPTISSERKDENTFTSKPNWSTKKKAVAWFVSNCDSSSGREVFVSSLKKHINIDIYGKCPGAQKCEGKAECNRMLQENYYFYLSFENSLCPDYVTEKLYRALAYDTIPVVFGGADYSQYLPTGSYINAREFPSPRHLAAYMKRVMKSEKLYAGYFGWKSLYRVDVRALQGWCHLCELLHNNSIERKTYPDISSWFMRTPTNQTCILNIP